MTELQPILDLLAGRFGWSPAVLGYIATTRLLLKFFSARLQRNLTARMVATAASADTEDDRDFTFLSARWYRVTAFLLDLVFSFKLPTHADFVSLVNHQPTRTYEN